MIHQKLIGLFTFTFYLRCLFSQIIIVTQRLIKHLPRYGCEKKIRNSFESEINVKCFPQSVYNRSLLLTGYVPEALHVYVI